jgi:hypothetical protein
MLGLKSPTYSRQQPPTATRPVAISVAVQSLSVTQACTLAMAVGKTLSCSS